MNNNEIKQKAISGVIWQSVQRLGSRIILLVGNLVFARLLSPDDFGLIGIIFVFLSFSEIIINGGFTSALIQKKNVTKDDFSTVFVWNLILACICYFILYITAPYISLFYKSNLLTQLLRVEGLVLFFYALCAVPLNRMQKDLEFKKLAIIDVFSSLFGCCFGIMITLIGYGIWGLVFKMLMCSLLTFLLTLIYEKKICSFKFSKNSFKELFGFGSFMFLSSFTNALFINFQAILIGKIYSAKDLGYYSQARKLEEIPVVCVTNIVSSVSFPLFSILQKEKERLVLCLRKNIKLVSYISFPLSTFLFVAAKPLVLFLFTEKWASSIIYFQLLCVSGILMPVNIANRDLFASIGRSRLFFTSQLVYKLLGIALMVLGIFSYGIMGLLYGKIIADYFLFFMNSYLSKKLVGYGTLEQLKDIFPNILISFIAGLILFFFINNVALSPIIQLICGFFVFGLVYALSSILLAKEQYNFCKSNIMKRIWK